MSAAIATQEYHSEQAFTEIRLEQTQFLASEFHDCTFARCSFVESLFRNCKFVSCVFQQCDLSLIRVPNCSFSAVRFEDSKAIGINWTEAHWPATKLWDPIHFSRCIISHSTFIGLNLKGIQIRECVAVDVDFREADLSQANLTGTDLSKSIFGNTNLTEADLSHARNYLIDPSHNLLKKARFSLPEAMSLLLSMDIILEE